MMIWHATSDAPRPPQRIVPGQIIPVVIGTWPIEPGQAVWVEWDTVGRDGRSQGTATAVWQQNAGVNSYWSADLGPFADGDRLTYVVRGSCDAETVSGGSFVATAKPVL